MYVHTCVFVFTIFYLFHFLFSLPCWFPPSVFVIVFVCVDVQTSVLMRVSSLSEHQFLLNHLLRCPAGVGSWGAELLQVAPPTRTRELLQSQLQTRGTVAITLFLLLLCFIYCCCVVHFCCCCLSLYAVGEISCCCW